MLVQEVGGCSGSLPRSATNLGYDMGELFVMGVALSAQKLPSAVQKLASDSSSQRDVGIFQGICSIFLHRQLLGFNSRSRAGGAWRLGHTERGTERPVRI